MHLHNDTCCATTRWRNLAHRWLLVLCACAAWPAAVSAQPLQVDALVQPAPPALLRQQAQAMHQPAPARQINLGHWQPRWTELGVQSAGGATETGAPRSIAATQTAADLLQQLTWSETATGAAVAALQVRSPEAYALRLGLLVQQLPPDATLRLYTPLRPEDMFVISGAQILQLLHQHTLAGETGAAAQTWWTPESAGDTVSLEITLPAGTPRQALQLALPQLVHVYTDVFAPPAATLDDSADAAPPLTLWPQAIGDAERCNLDASCYDQFARQRNAVARMSYVSNGRSYWCSGTLLNDTSGSYTPYFLTARHCIRSASEASSLQTSWFLRSSSCGASSLSGSTQTLRRGATLLYSTADSDISLLRLNEPPPANAVFAGWDAATVGVGQSVTGIHHPVGDLQKISFGQMRAFNACQPVQADGRFSCQTTNEANANYYSVHWSQGTTEGGSSGSGMFWDGRLSGVLSGGSGSCSVGTKTSVYGRLSSAFAALRPWLAPAATAIPDIQASRQPIYRFFNHSTGAHFYTPSAAEREHIVATLPSYHYEGIGFYAATAPSADLSPVARFFNTTSASHFYTIDAQERASVLAHLPQFRDEGLSWYASDTPTNGMRPIYRFYNAGSSTHFFTASESERDNVVRQLPSFQYEGIAYYVWDPP